MRSREKKTAHASRLMTLEELEAYTSLGESRARQFGKDASAIVRYGKRIMYDRKKVDEYIDLLLKEESDEEN